MELRFYSRTGMTGLGVIIADKAVLADALVNHV